jgi:hypothetical protein
MLPRRSYPNLARQERRASTPFGFELPVRGSDKAGCRPFFLRRLLGTGRRADRRAALQLFFIDIDRLTPLALSSKPFDGDPEGAGVVRMATVSPPSGVRNDYG